MGNGSSSQRYGNTLPPLAPFPYQTGLIQDLCHPYEITLKLKEQIGWSGDTFDITDINGAPCFVMKGRAMSFKQKKVLQDMNGTPLLNFRHEFSLFKKYCIYSGNSNSHVIATIRPHVFFGITADIEFTNWDGSPRLFGLEGNFLSSQATITDRATGAIAARISRSRWNANDVVWGQQTYYVSIAPNVDLALIICICVALDEAKNEK
ncbi:hypothetical protein CPB86DRAFT_734497 [Serendipita vermifera]|nr:hypothetical protein CPB86DRAFT_734497 [Serendipita vermifera]